MPVISLCVIAPSPASAKKIATTMVKEHLAACANILAPCTSVFYWQGKMQSNSEVPIVFKTSKKKLPRLVARIRQIHDYEVPCICWQVVKATKEYEEWVEGQTK
ncbi:divalent-cation tolerance protein CutA [Candidatus Micrarchaeota archaeon]|nr:divalent-cation tolerance protein CutA [Candidatus Micrarchaeota archaeon]